MTHASATFTESEVEAASFEWLEGLGWMVAHGPDIAPHAEDAERADYTEVVLEHHLRDALDRLNPDVPAEALADAFRKVTRPEGSTLETRNREFHRMLVDGVTVEYRTAGGALRGAQVSVLDYENSANNDWLAVNQFTVVESEHERRPDVVLFVNGLPLGLIELKNPAEEKTTVWTAWKQIQTYKAELTNLFAFNRVLIASDGVDARIGTLTAGREWFKPWRTISGETLAGPHLPQLQVVLEGICERDRFLTLVHDFIAFEDDGSGKLAKKMAAYHQFHTGDADGARTGGGGVRRLGDMRPGSFGATRTGTSRPDPRPVVVRFSLGMAFGSERGTAGIVAPSRRRDRAETPALFTPPELPHIC